jgi:uncharacterized protein YndB with AHSA1/START domain
VPQLTKATPEFAASASHKATAVHDLAASPEQVWATITNNSSWTKWFPTMTRCEDTSDPTSGIGSTRTVKVGPLVAEEEFIAWDENRLWAFTITKTNLPLGKKVLEQLAIEPHGDGGSRVAYTGAIEPTWFSRLTLFSPTALHPELFSRHAGNDDYAN